MSSHNNELMDAIKNHDLERFSVLIKQKCDLHGICGDSGASLLHVAVFEEQVYMVELLLEAGVSVEARSYDGSTPLHWIWTNNYNEISKLLLKYGANINAQDNAGATPLHNMIHYSNINRIRFLLKHKADPNLQDQKGETALHKVIAESGYVIINLLLKAGANPLIRNNMGLSSRDLVKNPSLLIDS